MKDVVTQKKYQYQSENQISPFEFYPQFVDAF